MRLYKAESVSRRNRISTQCGADRGQDEKPIQIIHLGSRAKIEHTYEESQAQGSWKIVSDGSGGQEVSLHSLLHRLLPCHRVAYTPRTLADSCL